MNISITYQPLNVENVSAIAAAFYRNIDMYEKTDMKGLSMAQSCDSITSRNAIICFLLNVDPLKETNNADILWHEKYIKPIIYKFYMSFNPKVEDKTQTNTINRILNVIDIKFGSILESKIRHLELVLWGDLYLILGGNLSKKLNKPNRLLTWFNEINKLEQLQKAVKLIFGDFHKNLTAILRNIHINNNMNSSEIEKELELLNLNKSSENAEEKSVNKVDETDNFNFLFGYKSVADPFVFTKPKLPIKNKRNILLSSALPYVNNVPHLGNLIGSTLSADVFSRYCRLRGWNCLYVCGTDEYGTTTEVKATEEKTTPKEICDHYHAIHAEVYKWFNIDFDVFGRTTMEEHTKIVTEVFESINKHGFILEDEVTQLYCESCDKFLADRLVEGICPFCSFEDARGDQCDKCGKLINTVELKSPRCKLCSNCPIFKTSKHLFLDLQKIQEKLESYLKETMNSNDCVWSTNAKSITNSWLKEGLKPRCITRDLKWGVPVPLDEFKGKVFYVWFDAVLGYLSITAHYTEHWKQWWIKQEGIEVELYQFMAKDNVPFHSVILPANLMATGERFNMIKQLASTEYLNYENTKFSKSRGLGVFGNDAIHSGIPADLWRFYLISSRPESQDSSFTWDEFATRINSELLNNFGNFINRALSFVVKFYGGLVPNFHQSFGTEHSGEHKGEHMEFVSDVSTLIQSYIDHMEQIKLRDSLSIVLKISGLGNAYIQKHKPWLNIKSEDSQVKMEAATVIGVAANAVALLGVLISPIMPETGQNILQQCNAPEKCFQITDDSRFIAYLQPNHQIGNVAPLFQKMEPEFVNSMKKKFSAGQ